MAVELTVNASPKTRLTPLAAQLGVGEEARRSRLGTVRSVIWAWPNCHIDSIVCRLVGDWFIR
jgi:hypothetical protein